MMMRNLRWIGTALLCGGLAAATFAADVKDVQKQIADKTKGLKSVRAKMVQVVDAGTPDYKMQMHTNGTYEWVRKDGDITLYRMESMTKTLTEVAGQKTETKSESLAVCDGTYVYTLVDTDGTKMATKIKQPPALPGETVNNDAEWDMRLLPDEKVDGAACWVVEMTPKPGTPSAAAGGGKTVNWFRQDNGWLVKMISYSPDGKPMYTTEYKDLEVDGQIDPSRFTFSLPPGVSLTEM
jgi:outer membrane lipoprotein-sorting protein